MSGKLKNIIIASVCALLVVGVTAGVVNSLNNVNSHITPPSISEVKTGIINDRIEFESLEGLSEYTKAIDDMSELNGYDEVDSTNPFYKASNNGGVAAPDLVFGDPAETVSLNIDISNYVVDTDFDLILRFCNVARDYPIGDTSLFIQDDNGYTGQIRFISYQNYIVSCVVNNVDLMDTTSPIQYYGEDIFHPYYFFEVNLGTYSSDEDLEIEIGIGFTILLDCLMFKLPEEDDENTEMQLMGEEENSEGIEWGPLFE